MGKRLLFVTTRMFWPADSGRKVSLWNYCRGLHDQLGWDVFVYAFPEADQSPADIAKHPNFIKDARIAKPIPRGTRLLNIINALPNKAVPWQCALYWSADNAQAMCSWAEELQPNVVMFDMIRLAPYARAIKDLGFAVVQDFDDLLSKRYRRQLNEGGNVLGKYDEAAGGITKTLMGSSVVKRAVLKSESNRVERAELVWGAEADAVLFVSPLESAEMNGRLGENKCFNATLGADIPEMHPSEDGSFTYDFGFVGNMYTAANQASLEYVCRSVLPILPGKTLRVIGVCPEEISRRYLDLDNVSFSGRVESIGDELTRCRLLLAPFAYGTGIKTKVLEAMGLCVPVVTNSIGIEGLSCKPGVEVALGETPQELAEVCETLLGDSAKRLAMAKAGREYVRTNHDWAKSVENLGACLEHAEQEQQNRQHGDRQ